MQDPKGVFMKVEDRGVKFPLIPGHEISGTIEEVGNGVNNFNLGDRVLVYPWLGDRNLSCLLIWRTKSM